MKPPPASPRTMGSWLRCSSFDVLLTLGQNKHFAPDKVYHTNCSHICVLSRLSSWRCRAQACLSFFSAERSFVRVGRKVKVFHAESCPARACLVVFWSQRPHPPPFSLLPPLAQGTPMSRRGLPTKHVLPGRRL